MKTFASYFWLIGVVTFAGLASGEGSTALDAKVVRLAAGESIDVTVENLEVRVRSKQGSSKRDCNDGSVGKLSFASSQQLGLKCGQAYGGIVRLHDPDQDDPQAGLVVAYDWGDEGCLSSITSHIELTKDGKIKVQVSTRNSGKMVDGDEKDCKPGLKRDDYEYNAKTRKFLKSGRAK